MQSGGDMLTSVQSVPGLIEPIGIQIDVEQLWQSVAAIYKATGFEESLADRAATRTQVFNFNHPKTIPDSVSNLHFGPLATGEAQLRSKFGMTTSDFTQMDPLVNGTYLETVYNQVQAWHLEHNAALGQLNRLHAAVLAHGAGYQMHTDKHTTIRYHIALKTNEFCYMLCKDRGGIKAVHIPADGRIWLLDTGVLHTALNMAPNTFDVPTMSNRSRTHLIFSVD